MYAVSVSTQVWTLILDVRVVSGATGCACDVDCKYTRICCLQHCIIGNLRAKARRPLKAPFVFVTFELAQLARASAGHIVRSS